MKRRHFLALSIATASGLTAGCKGIGPITDRWLDDSKYDETLSAFLITQDGKKLVVLGKQYHYVFDMPPQLRAVMTAPYRQKLDTEFIGFEAQGDTISGRYRMTLSRADAPPDSDARARAPRTASRTKAIASPNAARSAARATCRATSTARRYRRRSIPRIAWT
ncbi:hypothetical protein [Burkholderia ubonensis]|uniref:hypothetical protein n=1 Tax=Burkholderia ubonensis TaxID=101571 RepID=UPI0007C7C167|nr:hypothetical protein [Burkholderia ubonensis]